MPLSLMSAPAIAQDPTPPPPTTLAPTAPPSAPTTPTGKALAQAKKDNRRIEIESLRSETATYYANPDGKTLRMEQYLEPIRVKNAGGDGFTPVDTTLVEADGVIKPKAAEGGLTLSAGGNTEAIKSKSGDIAAQIDAPRTLPKPTLNGSTATYSSAYGKGVDLVVTATATGFRQQIVIRERPAGPVTFRVPVDLPKGISFAKNAKGQPTLKSDNGKHSLDIRPAALLDAAAADANADLGAVRVGRAQVSLDGSALVYSPDQAFLADPVTTYPVTMAAVDDDWYECTLGGAPCPAGDPMDTYINDVDLTDSWDMHYRDQMWVGKSYSSNIAKRWRAYIQFPLPGASDPFWGSEIQNADLELWNYLSNDCGEFVGSGITARRVTSDWDQLTLRWSAQPSVTSVGADNEPGAYSPDCSGSMNYEHDLIHSVDTIVQEWADGETNYGFQLTAGNESELRNWRRYRTREQTSGYPAHGPRLTVDFKPPTPPLQETVVITSREPLTSIPEYEEALTRSVYVPEIPESIESLAMSEEDVAANEQHRDGEGSLIGTDKISPSLPYPGDGDDTDDSDGGDTTAPRVRMTEPASDATDVPLDSQVRVTFSEAVEGPTISMKSAQGTDVQGTVALDSTSEIATFTPSRPLNPGTRYSIEVSEATDSWENIMMFSHTWSFRTVDQAAARWRFDEGSGRTAADSSGQGHNATLNDTASWTSGKNGSAVSNTPTQAQATASREATRQDKAVEVVDQTTATSITYAQPDGKTFTTKLSAGPVRTQQNGAWVPIDTTLVERNGVLKPKAIASDVAVAIANGGTGAFVSMTAADRQSYALRWPSPLPKPVISKNTATFTDAAGKGADLVVTVLPTGFRHDVVLRERPAAPLEVRIGVETSGLTLTEGKGGRLLFTGSKDKKLVASAPQPVMWDSSAGVSLTTSRLPRARHAKITTDVVTTDGKTELVLKPDHAFLSDPATKYPVRVDPTTTLPFNHDVDVSSTNTADEPADPTSPIIMAGTQTGNLKYRVHLRFDTAGLTGATVSDARLSLLNIGAQGCGSTVGAGIQVLRLTSAWDENNLHWANKPTSTTEDAQINRAGYDSACADPTPLEWPVTGIAQDWAGGAANHGLVLQSPTETNVNNHRVFPASEEIFDFNSPPTLIVTTTGPASAPTISALTVTPAQNSNGVTTVTSLTPQLAATVSDTIGGTLTGQFEIEHDPTATGQGTGQIWTGASAAVTSGTQTTATVPAGNLTDGWKVRWRARAANAAASTTSAWSAWQNATVDVPGPISEPTVGALQVNPSTVVDGTTVTSTLTPSLLAQVSDPAGGSLRAEYEIEHDPVATGQGTGQIWTGGVDNVASGTQAGIAVPAGKLIDGWVVRWRARAVAGQLSSAWSDWQQIKVDVIQPGEEPLAQTDGPVIHTDQSFTLSTWLRLGDKDGDYSVIEQPGAQQKPFRLGNTADHGLVLTFTSADTADATIEGVRSGVEPPVNEWFHLAGVYEASSRTATLYLNGNPIGNAVLTFPTWNATRAMTLGSQLSGAVDDVAVYQRPLTADEAAAAVAAASATHTPSALSAGVEPKKVDSGRVFTYEHPRLEDCKVSGSETGYAEYDARIQEKPYSSCWSAYLYIQNFEEEEDDDGNKIKRKAFTKGPAWFALAQSVADAAITVRDDDALRFRSTWVAHSYLGNETGTGVVHGGTTGVKPHDIKVFTRLDEFALVDRNGNVKVPGNKLRGLFMDMLVDADVKEEGDCNTGDPGGIRDISEWVTNSDESFLIRAEGSLAHNTICSFIPQISLHANGPGNFMNIPLYSQKVLDAYNKTTIGVLRHGSDRGENKRWVPNFRCDWKTYGATDPEIADRKYACVNTRAKRVFVMSKTRDGEFIEVIEHIEAALDTTKDPDTGKANNWKTSPPLRAGHNWDRFDLPPTKKILGNELEKSIPGNWAASRSTHAGEPLIRGPKGIDRINRNAFSNTAMYMDIGAPEENEWRKTYGTNYCKYYFRSKYPIASDPKRFPPSGYLECDEYPFATTEQGADWANGHYSVRAVSGDHNNKHGNAIKLFYAEFRVGTANPFWVLIEP